MLLKLVFEHKYNVHIKYNVWLIIITMVCACLDEIEKSVLSKTHISCKRHGSWTSSSDI